MADDPLKAVLKTRKFRVLILVVLLVLVVLLAAGVIALRFQHGEKSFLERWVPLVVVGVAGSAARAVANKCAGSTGGLATAGVVLSVIYSVMASTQMCLISNMASSLDINSTAYWTTMGIQLYFYAATHIYSMTSVSPHLHSLLFKIVVSYPTTLHFGGSIFGLILCPLFCLLPIRPAFIVIPCIPYILSAVGVLQSIFDHAWERVSIDMTNIANESKLGRLSYTRAKLSASEQRIGKVLRIVQITDPHLGTYMSVQKLKGICEKIVALDPDLVLLTGDFYCPEGDNTTDSLCTALAPLRALSTRVYACLGNHDKESARVFECVKKDLSQIGCVLLIDDSCVARTRHGDVQITGLDYVFSNHATALDSAFTRNAKQDNCVLEIVLLHDPKSFHLFPKERGCLTLSGHTHGGQLGLFSLGLRGTVVGLTGVPDNGLWGIGKNRLYVHRGQGFRTLSGNMVPRLGVPNEHSLLEVLLPSFS